MDVDLSLLEEVFRDVDLPKREAVSNGQSSFLADIAIEEADIALGRKPLQGKAVEETSNVEQNDKKTDSVIHKGDTDSEDDEDNKYFESSSLNDYGREVKSLLHQNTSITSSLTTREKTIKWKNELNSKIKGDSTKVVGGAQDSVSRDPVLGMRILNPLVSSAVLKERMIGRQAVPTGRIKNFLLAQDPKNMDWVTGGVITAKSIRTSQKGNQYCIWNLSDLQGEIKLISVFLFGTAYTDLWKTSVGMVVGILNPAVMESKDNHNEATLSVDSAQKVMLFGGAKDYGVCRSKKKNGDDCTAVINKSVCEYCIYHIKQEYQKCSRRTELQSSCAGRGLNSLRNKVLGKNEVFYAGRSFTSVPGKKTDKQKHKDEIRLKMLTSSNQSKLSQHDSDILNKLSGDSSEPGPSQFHSKLSANATELISSRFQSKMSASSTEPSPSRFQSKLSANATEFISSRFQSKLSASSAEQNLSRVQTTPKPSQQPQTEERLKDIPLLAKMDSFIDLDTPVSKTQKSRAKINALNFVKRNGPLKSEEASTSKKGKTPEQVEAIKRKIEGDATASRKKQKLQDEVPKGGKELLKEKKARSGITDEFLQLLNTETKNKEILQVAETEEQEKYFNRLEIREKMEEKMLSTFKVECKVVRCLTCNYKSFSASDLCKKERHPLKVVNGFKRFWKCGDCSARTVCLELIPLHSCNVCGSSRWEKTSMLKEKNGPNLVRENLSIRGHEEANIGGCVKGANLNLLVPEL